MRRLVQNLEANMTSKSIAILTLSTAIFAAAYVIAQEQSQPENGFCVTNQTENSHFFVVDAGASGRLSSELEPDETLCTPNFPMPQSGFVSVFERDFGHCSYL